MLSSNFKKLQGVCWRLVEAQHIISTFKLVDTQAEQIRLEELLETKKPLYPPELKDYHYLLFTPFRYAPYGKGSRFRKSQQKEGVFYASENIATAVAEIAYHYSQFFKTSPAMLLPNNPIQFTAFNIDYHTGKAIDLTMPPLNSKAQSWLDKDDYTACQNLADDVRKAGGDVIRSFSVRCLQQGKNISLLSWQAFKSKQPLTEQTWHIAFKTNEVMAICQFPNKRLTFSR